MSEQFSIRLGHEDLKKLGVETKGSGLRITVDLIDKKYDSLHGITNITFEYNGKTWRASADTRYEGDNYGLID